jgi:CRISPR-associated protein Csm4
MKELFSVYKLHFTSPLHLGDAREDYSVSLKNIGSDALYAALTACLATVGKTIPPDGDLGFTVSSLFPFYQRNRDDEAVYFLPRPLQNRLPELEHIRDAKKVKKVQWLDAALFSAFINGTDDVAQHIDHIHDEYLTDNNIEDGKFISSAVSPRVTVPRDYSVEKDATPFYMDRLFFSGYSGLYFMAKGDCTKLLEPALQLLQYEGIGTDRNVGNGQFEYSKASIELDLPSASETNYAMSLSMYIPADEDELKTALKGQAVAYDFMRRGGWITTPPFNSFRKNAVYAFTPGSVLSVQTGGKSVVKGKIVDLKPEGVAHLAHPVWRNGKALFIPIVITD